MRKIFPQFIVFGAVMLLAACGSPQTGAAPTALQTREAKETKTANTKAKESGGINFASPDLYKRMSGTLVFGEGVETFRPCGQKEDYWIFTASEDMWAELRDQHNSLATKPYEGVYVELYGWIGPRLHPIVGGEYASKFDGHVVVDDVLTIKKPSSSDCKR